MEKYPNLLFAGCVQLEYLLDRERRQRGGGPENSRRKLEGDLASVPKSLREMEKNRSGLEELVKRSDTHTSQLITAEARSS